MKFLILADCDIQSGIEEVLRIIRKTNYNQFFKSQNYGDDIECVSIILMCRDESLNFKQRIRHSKKEKTIYLDIMLKLSEYIKASPEWRMKTTIKNIFEELSRIIRKYKIKNFASEMFISDVLKYFTEHLPQYIEN